MSSEGDASSGAVKELTGRWLAVNPDGAGTGGMVIISETGSVRISGELSVMRIVANTGKGLDHFLFQVGEGDAQENLPLLLERRPEPADQVLHLIGKDGEDVEQWHRTVDAVGTPKIVARKSGGMIRRWTREGQLGSPKADKGKKCFPKFDDDDVVNDGDISKDKPPKFSLES